MIEQLIMGFSAVFTLSNVLFISLGIVIGIVFGVMPGLGAFTALAIMIPVTFYMAPVTAIAFLIGIAKGGTSGGAIPAILLNAPGDVMNVVTTRDGYPMAQNGKPVKAMRMALYSSVFGDCCSDVVLILLAAPMALLALKMGPAEMTSLFILALVMIAALSADNLTKGLIATTFGLFLGTIGFDGETGVARMTFGVVHLMDGISLNALAIGALALSSVISQLLDLWQDQSGVVKEFPSLDSKNQGLTAKEFFSHWKTLMRSAYAGTILGMIPGLGYTMAAILGYSMAKKASKTPEKFGKGHLDGVAASEAANSAVMGACLVPTIAMGIPGNLTAALLIGAFMIHGITPGPFMLEQHGDQVYGMFAAMLIANPLHALIGRFGSPIWATALKAPMGVVLSAVIVLCVVGVYISSPSLFEVGVLLASTGLGYIMRKQAYSLISFFMGFLLGPMLEHSLRQTVILYGSVTALFTEPIACGCMLISLFFIVRAIIAKKKKNG